MKLYETLPEAQLQGPVIQSIVSLTNSLVVKMLTSLVSTCIISDSQVCFAEKMWVHEAIHIFFSKNIGIYAIFNDKNFNDLLTNDIVSFEQLGPEKGFGGSVICIRCRIYLLRE